MFEGASDGPTEGDTLGINDRSNKRKGGNVPRFSTTKAVEGAADGAADGKVVGLADGKVVGLADGGLVGLVDGDADAVRLSSTSTSA
jgi:hypothetical protein